MCNISQELEQLEADPYTPKLSIEEPQIFVLNEAFTSNFKRPRSYSVMQYTEE
jgi:hypothetical protein